MGGAGGELRIPTLVLLFGLGIKLAGSPSLLVSLPTMLVGFVRSIRSRSARVDYIVWMVAEDIDSTPYVI